jgi:hypothetical protein
MLETKYGKYIIKGSRQDGKVYPKDIPVGIVRLDEKVIKGAFFAGCIWMTPNSKQTISPPAHTHDHDELLGFIGSNPEDQNDLGGEIEFWLDDEKHIITQSCFIFLPAGLKHNPFIFTRIERPILHMVFAPHED